MQSRFHLGSALTARGFATGLLLAGLGMGAGFGSGAAHAQPLNEPELIAGITATYRAYGCSLAYGQLEEAFETRGIFVDSAAYVIRALIPLGLVEISQDGETSTLTPAFCAAEGPEAQAMVDAAVAEKTADAPADAEMLALFERIDLAEAGRFIALLRGNGCQISDTDAEALIGGAGFTIETSRDIASMLFAADLAGLRPGGEGGFNLFVLHPNLCNADPAQDALRVTEALALMQPETGSVSAGEPDVQTVRAGSARAWLVTHLQANACEIALEPAGTDPAPARAAFMAAALEGLGLPDDVPGLAAGLEADLDVMLADPGPEFDYREGRLRLVTCTP